MKNKSFIFLALLGFVLVFVSCQKEETEPKYNATATVAPAITNPAADAEIVLLKADSANPFMIEWSAASYTISDGVLPNVVYSLTVIQSDSSWDGAKELINTTDLSFETIVYNFNNTLFSLGITPDVPTTIKLNVNAMVMSLDGPIALTSVDSPEITVTVTIFEPSTPPPPADPSMWVPGAYQGWSPADAAQIWDTDGDGVFEGFVYFPEVDAFDGNFKFTANPDWVDGGNYGSDGTEFGLDTDSGAGNLVIPEPGGYWLTCDVENLIWSYEAQSYGVIGSGILNGDWTEDVNMTAITAPYNVVEVTIDVTESQDSGDLRFKYRMNDAWDVNYGAEEGSDILVDSGPDILMPEGAGNYTFKMDLSKPVFTYSFTKN